MTTKSIHLTPCQMWRALRARRSVLDKHPDAIALLRINDNYHILVDDAQKTMRLLKITPNQTKVQRCPLKQISFPHHSLDVNLPILVRAGFRVVIVEDVYKKS